MENILLAIAIVIFLLTFATLLAATWRLQRPAPMGLLVVRQFVRVRPRISLADEMELKPAPTLAAPPPGQLLLGLVCPDCGRPVAEPRMVACWNRGHGRVGYGIAAGVA